MAKVVVDTSVIIDHLRIGKGLWEELVKLVEARELELYCSPIVITELWAGESINKDSMRQKIEKLIALLKRIEISDSLAMRAGELMRVYGLSGFDALIAASALEINASVATANFKHFKKVVGLKSFETKI